MIPVSEPDIGEAELELVSQCVRSGWISSSGHFIEQFEKEWAAFCGRRYGVAVSNGTAALEAAVAVLELKPGDEVILPTSTIISCAVAVLQSGAVPVLVDADPHTWCMDVAQATARITPRTRAIMPVHIYGHPTDMTPLLDAAARHGVHVIEDAAEAHGAEYLVEHGTPRATWRRCGSFGTLSTFSFYANKIITTGEGGMVLTDDEQLCGRLQSMRNLCFEPQQRFLHRKLGHNWRLTNTQAAIGVAQLRNIEHRLARKRRIAQRYLQGLSALDGVQLPVQESWARNVYWMFGMVLDPQVGFDAAECARRLRTHDIETRPFFLGMHEQPALRDMGLFAGEKYPTAERIARQGLYLPSGLTLTDAQVDEVCVAVRKVLT
jgi:perosamine synthetase